MTKHEHNPAINAAAAYLALAQEEVRAMGVPNLGTATGSGRHTSPGRTRP